MIMMNADQYNQIKKEDKTSKKDAPDIEEKKFYDNRLKKEARKKNRDEETNRKFNEKIKPLFALYNSDLEQVLKKINPGKKPQANFVLQVLTRLPKVSINQDRLMIDGEPMKEPASRIVTSIVDNGVTGTQSIIKAMQAKSKRKRRNPTVSPSSTMTSVSSSPTTLSSTRNDETSFMSVKDGSPPKKTSTPRKNKSTTSAISLEVTDEEDDDDNDDDNDDIKISVEEPRSTASGSPRRKSRPKNVDERTPIKLRTRAPETPMKVSPRKPLNPPKKKKRKPTKQDGRGSGGRGEPGTKKTKWQPFK